jgi:type I restriction enzyme, S subunit
MENEWKEYPISEVCDLIVDCVNKTAPKVDSITPYKMLRTTNVRYGKIDTSDCFFVIEEVFEKWTRRAKLLIGDVLLTREAPLGEVGIVNTNENLFLGQRLMQYRSNPRMLDSKFLLYSFLSPYMQSQFKMHEGSGSVVSHIRVPDCSKFQIKLPPLPIQKSIAHILGSLDDKIELNRRMNQTLEQMAQALFKSWFVDFDPVIDNALAAGNPIPDELQERAQARQALGNNRKPLPAHVQQLFPNEFEFSEVLEKWVPRGWRVISLYDTAEFINGTSFRHDDFTENQVGLPIIKIAELKAGINDQTKFTSKHLDPKYFIKRGDVLYSWSGSPETSLEVFKWHGIDGWLNQHIFKINVSSKEREVFVFYLLKHLRQKLVDIAKNKQTTGLGHVTIKDMQNLFVVLPSNEEHLMPLLKSMYDKDSASEIEVADLKILRDTLLPKLLAGELNVEKASLVIQ